MSKSTRQVGKSLENYLLEILQKTDSKAKLTNNSGAVSNNGDITHRDYYVECKKRNTKNITIDIDVWNKLCRQIPMNSFKTPILALENESKDRFVVMQLSDFERLITKE